MTQLIISVQSQAGDPTHHPDIRKSYMKTAIKGGADGLRLADLNDIAWARQEWPQLTIIGLTKPDPLPKNWLDVAYITPTLADMIALADAGATMVATDATQRAPVKGGNLTLEERIMRFKSKHPEVSVLGDIDSFDTAVSAQQAGVNQLATTLSGYTTLTHQPGLTSPDWGLLYQLTQHADVPVWLEGRVWSPEDVAKGTRFGAAGIVVGSAITRPWQAVARYKQAI
jgi:N-acylglucosamine-6-phosphate 2-epimerase